MKINLNGSPVDISGENAEAALRSEIFKQWASALDQRFKVHSIHFQSVDIIGQPDRRRTLFIKFVAEITEENGLRLPGIVFMRGGGVTMLIILVCEGREYVLLTLQPRFPTGHFSFPELPAGMLNGQKNFSGVVAQEVRNETGIEISVDRMIDLTELAYGSKWRGIFPSPGTSDEFFRIFLHRAPINRSELDALSNKLFGLEEEGEQITLRLVPFEEVITETPDNKVLCAITLYRHLQEVGKIQRHHYDGKENTHEQKR